LGVLAVSNLEELNVLIDKAKNKSIKYAEFREEDLNNEITAIVLECCSDSKRICRSLKLALKE